MEQDAVQTLLKRLAQFTEEYKDSALAEVTVPLELMEQVSKEFHKVVEQLSAAQKHLMDSEKMTMLGNLMAGIAHEISTPVASISSNIDLFARSLGKIKTILSSENMPEEIRGNQQITRAINVLDTLNQSNQTACDRILQLVRSLRGSLHGNMTESREIDVHEELENALTLVHHELKGRIEVIREYGDIPRCICIPTLLNSVFVNMLVNASQAIEGKGQIRIETSVDEGAIRIKFTDTGVGIAPENLEKLFVPGFTTKAPDEGTGLGLTICKRIIDKHHGKIEVESELGKGTTFTIYIRSVMRKA